jgi:hypothetical protein
MFTGMKEILIQATQIVYGNLLTVKKGFVAGFSAKQIMKLLLLSKLCIENSNNECRT